MFLSFALNAFQTNSAQYISGTAEGPARPHVKWGERGAAAACTVGCSIQHRPPPPSPPGGLLGVICKCIVFPYVCKQTGQTTHGINCRLFVCLIRYLCRCTAQGCGCRGDGWIRRHEDTGCLTSASPGRRRSSDP